MNINDHENDFFCISKRLMSLISAGFLLVLFFVFMTGYVWGKRVALEDILKTVEQKTFADQISGSLYTLAGTNSDIKKEDSDQKQTEVDPVIIHVVENKTDEATAQSFKEVYEKSEAQSVAIAEKFTEESKERNPDVQNYYAQLIGFNSKKAADQWADRIKHLGLEPIVKERISKNAYGKRKSWYQVVTQRYTNKEELERLVAHITKKEHLSGVHIIAS